VASVGNFARASMTPVLSRQDTHRGMRDRAIFDKAVQHTRT
jgi:hypothetical protein